jgi:hypothetical protein
MRGQDLWQRRSSRVIAIVGSVLVAIGLTVSSNAAATSATTTSTIVLFGGHGVGIVATYDLNTGCSEVFLSTDMIKWRNITPPLKNPAGIPKGQCPYVWNSAYFVSPSDGWLLARNGGSTNTILRHTLDGGRTWITQPGGDTGSNGGGESISFVSAALGWRQQFGFGSNFNFSLERTLNGGTTWATRSPDPQGSCISASDVFASANVGFASVTWAPATNPTHLWRTNDGGVHWSLMTLPRPSSVPSTTLGLYGKPVFSGLIGVVPVDYPDGNRQAVYFYVTHDGGLRWTLDSVHPRVVVGGVLRINRQSAAAQPCFGGTLTPVASRHVVVIAAASPTTWWILQPGVKGEGSVSIVSLKGDHIASTKLRDLPSTQKETALAALNSKGALLTLPIPYGYQSTYETSNSGASWTKLDFPTPTETSAGLG